MVINFREGNSIIGGGTDVRVGTLRYSSSRRFQQAAEKAVPFYVSPADFLGKRTALFGMTRTGKSNTVKKIIQATVEISDQAGFDSSMMGKTGTMFDNNPVNPLTEEGKPKFPVGQLIFDINGEYANANLQDEGTAIFELYTNRVTRYSLLNKPDFKVMKTNFFNDIEEGFELLRSLLLEDDTRFVQNFCAVDLSKPGQTGDNGSNRSALTRYNRRIAAYKCCLYLAGFKTTETKLTFPGESTLNALVTPSIDPSKGISFDEAVSWFTAVWDAYSTNPFFANYRTSHQGREWADEDLKAILAMLTRRREPGNAVNISGFRVLKKAVDRHTETVDKPFAQEIVEQLRQGKIVIADLSQGDPVIAQLYSEKICQRIFNDAMRRFIANESNNFIQIYFEEAHNLFPKKEDRNLSQIYNRLAKEGAKLNIGIIYATQEVSSISSNILKNTQNWFVAHLNNIDELKEIQKYYDYEDFLEGLGRFSASTDKGFIRVKTYSNAFTVPVQVDRFSATSVK